MGSSAPFVAGLKLVGTVFGEGLFLFRRGKSHNPELSYSRFLQQGEVCFTNKLICKCYFCVSNLKGAFEGCEILLRHYN